MFLPPDLKTFVASENKHTLFKDALLFWAGKPSDFGLNSSSRQEAEKESFVFGRSEFSCCSEHCHSL